jgi:two-component system, LuxR family, response regulator DctR
MNTAADVWIVDDEPVVREALAWLLRSRQLSSRLFESREVFMHALHDTPPTSAACVILDVRLEGASGIEIFAQLKRDDWIARLPVIFLSGHGDIPMAVDAVKQGAFDFFEKPFNDNALVDRVEQALLASSAALATSRSRDAVSRKFDSLSERERQVMERILAGRLNKQIADDLQIAMRTVEVHRSSIFTKMGVRSAVELAQILTVLKP